LEKFKQNIVTDINRASETFMQSSTMYAHFKKRQK